MPLQPPSVFEIRKNYELVNSNIITLPTGEVKVYIKLISGRIPSVRGSKFRSEKQKKIGYNLDMRRWEGYDTEYRKQDRHTGVLQRLVL